MRRMPKTKVCRVCEIRRPLESFHKRSDSKDGLNSTCKVCRAANWSKSGRKWRLASKYGITQEDWDRMLEEQGGVCAACGVPGGKLVTDHCHQTGQPRFVLHHSCNIGIGMFGDHADLIPHVRQFFDARRASS